jgi:hypothetical protein
MLEAISDCGLYTVLDYLRQCEGSQPSGPFRINKLFLLKKNSIIDHQGSAEYVFIQKLSVLDLHIYVGNFPHGLLLADFFRLFFLD